MWIPRNPLAVAAGINEDIAEPLAYLRAELGDLLLQVAYHAQMAAEADRFDFDAVAHGIADKMIERHPHVFGSDTTTDDAALRAVWEERKAQERARKAAAGRGEASLLADVPLALPALVRALKLQKRAARVGFDWGAAGPILAKLREELDELEAELAGEAPALAAEAELGDLLFTVVNLARHLGIDPETALRAANGKFERRFRSMEDKAQDGHPLAERPLDELEAMETPVGFLLG